MTKEVIFEQLWKDYITFTPAAKNIHDLFVKEGEKVINDHIAYRTFNDPRINVDVLAKEFIKAGYKEKGQYTFEQKKLFAKHYEHTTDKDAPRVFISQLKVEEFSPLVQDTVKKAIDSIPFEMLQSPELLFSGRLWAQPNFSTYETLRKESEYAAWLYVFGFRVNHFTVSINHLKKLNTIEKVNQFLKDKKFILNSAGGEIKGTREELLQQSSVMAEILPIEFTDGIHEIPTCYYEFALRHADKDGQLYSGFIAKSADKIFESTNFYQ